MLNEIANYPKLEAYGPSAALTQSPQLSVTNTSTTQKIISLLEPATLTSPSISYQDQSFLMALLNSTFSFLNTLVEKVMSFVSGLLSQPQPQAPTITAPTTQVPGSTPAETSAPITPAEASEPVEASAASEAETLPTPARALKKKGDFLWKPTSEKDGKLVILTPARLTGRIQSVNILSSDGSKVLAKGKFSGVGNGDREHFRFTKAGADFAEGSIVQIKLTNGDIRTVRIEKPAARTTR